MDTELAKLVVRSYNPMRHRTGQVGYLNHYIQQAVAALANRITEEIETDDGLIYLVGSKCSGTALGVVAQMMHPARFRFACAEHEANYPALNEIAKVNPDKVILIDDFICQGDTVAKLREKVAFGRMIVIHTEPEGLKIAQRLAKVHVLSHDDWLEGSKFRKGKVA